MGISYSGVFFTTSEKAAKEVANELATNYEHRSGIYCIQYKYGKLAEGYNDSEYREILESDGEWCWYYVSHDYPEYEPDFVCSDGWEDNAEGVFEVSVSISISIDVY